MTTTSRTDAPQTWLITGATRGFGRSIARTALEDGDRVVAAVRRPEAMDDLAAEHGDRLLVVRFEATDVHAAPAVVEAAVQRFGGVDVLVNNAGRGVVGAAEEISDEVLRSAMDLHLMVPAALVRAVLPGMRGRGRGTIVQMSSQGGRLAFAGVGAYCAGKFALEGWSEALAGEVAPFGVRVMLVEPSRFRTAFNDADALRVAEVDPAYADAELLSLVRADLTGSSGRQEGDPDRAARVIVDLVRGEEVPLRLPLGAEAVERTSASHRDGLTGVEQWADVARSTDYPAATATVVARPAWGPRWRSRRSRTCSTCRRTPCGTTSASA